MAAKNGAIKLVSGNSNPSLAHAIGTYLGNPLTKAVGRRFADMDMCQCRSPIGHAARAIACAA